MFQIPISPKSQQLNFCLYKLNDFLFTAIFDIFFSKFRYGFWHVAYLEDKSK